LTYLNFNYYKDFLHNIKIDLENGSTLSYKVFKVQKLQAFTKKLSLKDYIKKLLNFTWGP